MSDRWWAETHLGLRAHHVESSAGHTVDDLIVPGLRRNPRRAHLWVSTVLGKHIPVAPSAILHAADDLADLATAELSRRGLDTDITVFGFAETATGLGHCVAHRMAAATYLHSTRRTHPGAPVFATFTEGHSHATDHRISPTDADLIAGPGPLVLVDDEISTGDTALDAIASLHAVVPRGVYVVASLVDMRSDEDRARCSAAAIDLGVDVAFVSLARGRAEIPDDLVDRVLALPAPEAPPSADTAPGSVDTVVIPWPASVPDGGRHGFLVGDEPAFAEHVRLAADAVADHLDADAPVVVIGHEELMYLPLRIAAELERRGCDVRSQTTTRSPAHVFDDPGYPLRHGMEFLAPEAQWSADAPRRHLYNAAADEPGTQRVLVVDTPADTAELRSPDGLIAALTARGRALLVAVVGATDFVALARARSDS
ncbi:phosphoribosyltransferase [Williamsia sp. Leaf354]|uniref:phosphoribosyltransferase family protein n=1 Tax=Williamsia sp. Leaf354 TaxID=1736349 RepID=UPI0006F6A3E5|nr:phosphoribosyltransferase family protein [Williamsia sp. Leaf354]KQR98561.1 phosphoribosyltransferase [Williamsia sp. Leaf354]